MEALLLIVTFFNRLQHYATDTDQEINYFPFLFYL